MSHNISNKPEVQMEELLADAFISAKITSHLKLVRFGTQPIFDIKKGRMQIHHSKHVAYSFNEGET